MTAEKRPRFLPDRLQAVPQRWYFPVRVVWLATLAFAVLMDLGGAGYVLHDTFKTRPLFASFGLSPNIGDYSQMTVDPLGPDAEKLAIAPDSRIAAIDGQPVAPDILQAELADRLKAIKRQSATFTLVSPDGQTRTVTLERSPRHLQAVTQHAPIPMEIRLTFRLALSFLSCLALIACATLLYRRRPRDPVALLFSFAFLIIASTIDPPLMMWLAFGFGSAYDFVFTAGWLLLLNGLAAFPDGRYIPSWLRLTIPATIPLAIVLAAAPIGDWGEFIAGIGAPLAVLVGQIVRYRRLPPGVERQQIKWAGFGFAIGILLLGAALAWTMTFTAETGMLSSIGVTTLFNLGLIAMPLGLLVSLLRFRLWEADRLIGRSAAYALITVVVGIAWAASTDIVKDIVLTNMGEGNEPIANTLSAIVAVGLFSPTQALVLGWSERYLNQEANRLRALSARLAVWRATDTPEEIATRALDVIVANVHCTAAAILGEGPHGTSVLALRDMEAAEALAAKAKVANRDPAIRALIQLEDDGCPVGLLVLGPRSDGNRYNRRQLDALTGLSEGLAEAIALARRRVDREMRVEETLKALAQRLERIEAGMARP